MRAGAAYNNLAQILMEQGRYPEALEMARKAVSLGGPLQAVYHQTLREIESKMSQQKIYDDILWIRTTNLR